MGNYSQHPLYGSKGVYMGPRIQLYASNLNRTMSAERQRFQYRITREPDLSNNANWHSKYRTLDWIIHFSLHILR